MSVTATAVITSAFFAAGEVDAASHKVKSGDSLWAIAQQHNTSVSSLKSLNNLSSDLIFPNQVIKTNSSKSSSTSSSSSGGTSYTVKSGDALSVIASKHNISLKNLMAWNNLNTTLIYPGDKLVVSKSGSTSSGSSSGGSNKGSTYVIKSGDTLSHIASRNNVSVASLKRWNNLSSDMIYAGQKLSINGTSSNSNNSSGNSSSSSNSGSQKPSSNVSYNVDELVKVAKAAQGTKYVWGGQTLNGFDCSGFIHYAYNKAGKSGSRLSTDGYYDRSYYVDNPQVGDLVFFSGTYRAGISHMGIYIGNNEFIHAGTSTGVTITNLNNSYWSKHYEGTKRFY